MVLKNFLDPTRTPFSAGKIPIFHLLLWGVFPLVYFVQNEADQRAHEANKSLARDFETQTNPESPSTKPESKDACGTVLCPHPPSAATPRHSRLCRVHCPELLGATFYTLLKIKASYQPYTRKSLSTLHRKTWRSQLWTAGELKIIFNSTWNLKKPYI